MTVLYNTVLKYGETYMITMDNTVMKCVCIDVLVVKMFLKTR